MSVQLTFNKTSKGKGTRILGKLKWLNDEYEVITGGYGKGALPDGLYSIEVYKAVEGDKSTMKLGFINPITGRGWFLPLTPKFSTSRHGFGIHPDGNLPGNKGGISLQHLDAKKFWDKWLKTPLKSRPTSLLVTNKVETKAITINSEKFFKVKQEPKAWADSRGICHSVVTRAPWEHTLLSLEGGLVVKGRKAWGAPEPIWKNEVIYYNINAFPLQDILNKIVVHHTNNSRFC